MQLVLSSMKNRHLMFKPLQKTYHWNQILSIESFVSFHLETSKDKKAGLEEIFRVLKPGGKLVIAMQKPINYTDYLADCGWQPLFSGRQNHHKIPRSTLGNGLQRRTLITVRIDTTSL